MCGRYALETGDDFDDRFGVEIKNAQKVKNYNVFPGQEMPVIINHKGVRALKLMKWGFIPGWVKDPKEYKYTMINARAEGITEKPSYSEAIKRRRCIVPANGFYEWKNNGSKTPYFIHSSKESYLSLGGIYEEWIKEGKDKMITYAIITTAANKLLSGIHERMPVIIDKEKENEWLNDDFDSSKVTTLTLSHSINNLEGYPVSFEVNSPTNNSDLLVRKRDNSIVI